jgi:hypothetical protein
MLYKARWQVELFFKWIKQHLRIKAFYGTSANAVKTQVWIAVSVYVLVAILKKRLDLDQSLYTILQFSSVSIFEKTPVSEAFSQEFYKTKMSDYDNHCYYSTYNRTVMFLRRFLYVNRHIRKKRHRMLTVSVATQPSGVAPVLCG